MLNVANKILFVACLTGRMISDRQDDLVKYETLYISQATTCSDKFMEMFVSFCENAALVTLFYMPTVYVSGVN